MGILDLKNTLKGLNQKDLMDLIIDLYQGNKYVKEQLDYRFTPNEDELIKVYKKKVLEAFYPKHGDQFHLKIGKQAITDFRKFQPRPDSLIDLMMYYVECGVRLTREYGDINDNFYSSLASVYSDVMKLISKGDFYNKFKDRAFGIVDNTKDIGWGFHDFVSDVYGETYG